ncbi:hypothetical protein BX600DRAFT_548891 [Xylariales sp. PMI_506]|nr:hypothetical protein BX600DRAFT_548891 [Xylariales sp. PMI_506]
MADNAYGGKARAIRVCLSCKTRKKKCDKVMPICTFCREKQLECNYISNPRRRHGVKSISTGSPHTSIRCEGPVAGVLQELTPTDTTVPENASRKSELHHPALEYWPEAKHGQQRPNATNTGSLRRQLVFNEPSWESIHLEVQSIIDATGQFVDDITARYFQTFQRHLPIIYRTRFQSSLLACATGHSPGTSLLLLSICLITKLSPVDPSPARDGETPAISRQTLYLAAKALLAQAQGLLSPSVHLIQANLLLAIYEYANGRPEAAFITISSCARMGYAAQINDSSRWDGPLVEAEEAANTWWGIVIYERVFLSELHSLEQPLVTATLPTRLPIEYDVLSRGHLIRPDSLPSALVSCTASRKISGFGGAAQAAHLLDQILKALSIADIGNRLILLQGLDDAIQAFLAMTLPHCQEQIGIYCAAIAIAFRGLVTLHCHIMNIPQQTISVRSRTLKEWQKSSVAALDSVTKMAIDIADCHNNIMPPDAFDTTPPSHMYIARAVVRHMHTRPCKETAPWEETAEDQLRLYLMKFYRRWDIPDVEII